MDLRARLNRLRTIARGARRGRFWPAESRLPVVEAPRGSSRSGPKDKRGIRVLEHRIPLRHLEKPVSLLQVSDVHVREPSATATRQAQRIGEIEADILFLTGDIVAREWTPAGLHDFLARLPEAPLGRFACMGNWEWWAGFDTARWAEILDRHRIRLLVNEGLEVGGLWLCAIDDILGGKPDLEAALAHRPASLPVVLGAHCPGAFPDLVRPDVHLVLSGHTHGGQLLLPPLGALWVPRGSGPYVRGFYEQNGTRLYVSGGVGWSLAPIRIGAYPEVAVHYLIPEESP